MYPEDPPVPAAAEAASPESLEPIPQLELNFADRTAAPPDGPPEGGHYEYKETVTEPPLAEAQPAPQTFEPSPFEPPSFEPQPFESQPFESPLPEGAASLVAAPPAELVTPEIVPAEIVPGEIVSAAPAVSTWKKAGQEVVAAVQTLVSAAVYATLIVTFGFQVARVDGLSMAPTLEDHDRLIVNKLVYEIGEPRPGDIVMLYYPVNPEKMFVKRVIAKEGDQVRIVDGRVYVNEIALQDDYVPSEYRSHDDWGPSVIQPGYYFVMGDHRNNSSDSRHWGPVPKKYIVGKVKVRWWPLQQVRIF